MSTLEDLLRLVNENFPEAEYVDRSRNPLAGIKRVVLYARLSRPPKEDEDEDQEE